MRSTMFRLSSLIAALVLCASVTDTAMAASSCKSQKSALQRAKLTAKAAARAESTALKNLNKKVLAPAALTSAKLALKRAATNLKNETKSCDKKKYNIQKAISKNETTMAIAKSKIQSGDLLAGLVNLAGNCDATSFLTPGNMRGLVSRYCGAKKAKQINESALATATAQCVTSVGRVDVAYKAAVEEEAKQTELAGSNEAAYKAKLQSTYDAAVANKEAKQKAYDAAGTALDACYAAVQ